MGPPIGQVVARSAGRSSTAAAGVDVRDELIFTHPRFHDLNGVPASARFRHVQRTAGRVVGVLDGVLDDGTFTTGYSAPFGGPDMTRASPTLEEVWDLVGGGVAAAREAGARRIRWHARPAAYGPAEPLVEYTLAQHGFRVVHCALSMHIDLGPVRDGRDPVELLRRNKRAAVRSGVAGRHELVEAGEADVDDWHAVLRANRAAHDRPVGLSADYFRAVRQAFPGRIWLITLRIEDRPVAAAAVFRVLSDIDFVVNWGDLPDHGLRHSPMDLLAHLVALRSLSTGAHLLDLGPASGKDGSPDMGLTNFKRSVGAVPGTRCVYEKECS